MNHALRFLRGPALLMVWQAAPVAVQQDTSGRLYLSFGAEAGSAEARLVGCGTADAGVAVPFRSVGAGLEYWPTPAIRVTAAGGAFAAADSTYPFGAIQLGGESPNIGFGVGIGHARWPSVLVDPRASDRFGPTATPGKSLTGMSLHLRAGRLDRLHTEFDVLPPTETLETAGYFRVGVGTPREPGKAYGLFGIASGPFSDEAYPVRVFGEYTAPLNSRLDLQVHGILGSGFHSTTAGLSAGVKIRLGGD